MVFYKHRKEKILAHSKSPDKIGFVSRIAVFLLAFLMTSGAAITGIGSHIPAEEDMDYDTNELEKEDVETRITEDLREKMDSLENSDEEQKIDVFIELSSFREKKDHASSLDSEELISELKTHADISQDKVSDQLERVDFEVEILNTFWISNEMLIEIHVENIEELKDLPGIERIKDNFEVEIQKDKGERYRPPEEKIDHDHLSSDSDIVSDRDLDSSSTTSDDDLTWGLDRINADEVWDSGIKGSDVRVAVSDTGADIDHPDLEDKMINLEDDDHHTGGWIEFDSTGSAVEDSTPHDTHGHGTHCSGTVLGGDASGTHIGVAPESDLMHALTLPHGSGSFAQLLGGMEWAIEPHDRYGEPLHEKYGGDVEDYRAHVHSMSWGIGGYDENFEEPVKNSIEAGVVPVSSSGNDGEKTIGSPAAIYESFSIGATEDDDDIADFSSGRIIDEDDHDRDEIPEEYVRPDFSAPGVDVFSAVPDEDYASWSGTSMAAPHVAGTIALMFSVNPELSVDEIYDFLSETADYYEAGENLGEEKNTRYGHGIIDAQKAVAYCTDFYPLQPENITKHNATIRGRVTSAVFEEEDEVDVFFKYRKEGEDEWDETEEQTISEPQTIYEELTGLESETEYEYKLTVEGEDSEGVVSLITFADIEIETRDPDEIQGESAELKGEVTYLHPDNAEVFFRYREKGETEWNETERTTINEEGTFVISIDGLDAMTCYEYKAISETEEGEFYGDVHDLWTAPPEPQWDEEEEAYILTTAKEVQWLAEDLDSDYIVDNDIDMSETEDWYEGRGFKTAGLDDFDVGFEGTLEGAGHELDGLHIDRDHEGYVSLLHIIGYDGVVRNVSFTNSYIENTYHATGLTGLNYGKIENVGFEGKIRWTGDVFDGRYVAGLTAVNLGDIERSSVTGEIELIDAGFIESGGIASFNLGNISKSYFDGDLMGHINTGGLVAESGDDAQINESFSAGKIDQVETVGAVNVGGLTGEISSGDHENVYSLAEVSGESESESIGGLIGKSSFREDFSLNNAYSIGSVEINEGSTDRYDKDEENILSEIDASSPNPYWREAQLGGLIGEQEDIPPYYNVNHSYWDILTSEREDSEGGEGLTTPDMQGASATQNLDLDFGEKWYVVEANREIGESGIAPEEDGYPILQSIDVEKQIGIQDIDIGEIYDEYDLTVIVQDEEEEPIEDAKVELEGWKKLTDSHGHSEFTTIEGDHTITANKLGYYEDSKEITLDEDKTVTLTTDIREEYSLTVIVEDGEEVPSEEAEVKIYGETFEIGTTDSEGEAIFVLYEGKYDIEARKESGLGQTNITIAEDKDVSVILDEISEKPVGLGTEDNPYELYNWHHLDYIRNQCQEVINHYELQSDLDSETDGYQDYASETANGGKGWEPIGELGERFTGIFDGNEHTISDLNVNREDEDFVSLFGDVVSSEIKDLELVDVEIVGGFLTAALADLGGNSTVKRCYSSGTIEGGFKDQGRLRRDFGTGGLISRVYGSRYFEDSRLEYSYSSAEVIGREESFAVGGLVGTNTGVIKESLAAGNVTSENEIAGGLVGFISFSEGFVGDSYALGDVNGEEDTGGVIARTNKGTVKDSYAAGEVSPGENAGGLIGYQWDSLYSLENSYWDVQTTGQDESDGGTGLNTTEMIGVEATDNMALYERWSAVAEGERIAGTGLYPLDDGYPILQNVDAGKQLKVQGIEYEMIEDHNLTVIVKDAEGDSVEGADVEVGSYEGTTDSDGQVEYTIYEDDHLIIAEKDDRVTGRDITLDQDKTVTVSLQGGLGTEEDPYQIENWIQLDNIRKNLTAHYELISDLDENTDGYYDFASTHANTGKGWNPIGEGGRYDDRVYAFRGGFDGQGYEIKNLVIERPKEEHIGMFGSYKGESYEKIEIKNLSLVDVDVYTETREGTGGLIGYSEYTDVTDCYVNGEVKGDRWVGGLIGFSRYHHIIEGCYSTVDVTGLGLHGTVGGETIGGLVGGTFGVNIKNCYATGNVTGVNRVGGLIGSGSTHFENCYATGNITGEESVGGLIGYTNSDVIDSFSLERAGLDFIGGGDPTMIGRCTDAPEEDMKKIELYNEINWEDYDNLEKPWDIETKESYDNETWFIEEGIDYPKLDWEHQAYETYELIIETEGEGSEINYGEGTHTFEANESITLEADPEEGWEFDEWTGYEESDEKTNNFNMPSQDITMTAHFEEEENELTIDTAEDDEGEVYVDGEWYGPEDLPETFNYTHGEEADLNAIPDDGWLFSEWFDEINDEKYEAEPDITVEMNQNKELTAQFKKEEYTIAIDIDGEGEEQNYGEGNHEIEFDEQVELEASSEEGWNFIEWTGYETSDEKVVSFDMPAEDITMTAEFETKDHTLTVDIDGEGEELNYGEGEHNIGYDEYVELEAESGYGWEFVEWTGYEETDEKVVSFDMPSQDTTMTAEFERKDYELEIIIEGEGSEVNHGEGIHTFEYEESITLEAESDTSWEFEEWTGYEDSTDKDVSFYMPSEDVTMTAHFEKEEYELEIVIDGKGEELEYGEGTHEIEYGENVELEASSEEGWNFIEWTGYETSDDKVVSFDMPAEDITMTADFEKEEYNLTIDIDGEGEELNYGEGEHGFEYEETIILEASSKDGWYFVEWIGYEVSQEKEVSFDMPDEDITMTAQFESEDYTLSIYIEGGGEELNYGEGEHNIEHDEQVEINAESDEGWEFVEWTGYEKSDEETVSFEMPAENIKMTARFEMQEYKLEIIIDGEGSETNYDEGTQVIEYDEDVELKAESDTGWKFVEWRGYESSKDKTVTFEMPSADIVMSAYFEKDVYELEIILEGEGNEMNYGEEKHMITYLDNIELEAESEHGWNFVEWDGYEYSDDKAVSLEMPAKDITMCANFQRENFTLEWSINGEGEILIDGEWYVESGSKELKFDHLADLHASPDEDWIFENWTGDLTSRYTDETIEVVKNKSITANFVKEDVFKVDIIETSSPIRETKELNVTVHVKNIGEVSNTQEIKLYDHDEHELESIQVNLDGGSSTIEIINWRTEIGDSDLNYNLTVKSEDDSDTEQIDIKYLECELTIKVEGEGTTYPSVGTHTYERNDEVVIRAEPNEGWRLKGWEDDKNINSTVDEDITIDIYEDREITIIFEKDDEVEISTRLPSRIALTLLILILILIVIFFILNKRNIIIKEESSEKTRSHESSHQNSK